MRRTVVIILSIAILCSLFVVVFAVANSNTEDGTAPLAGNPFEYAQAPDGLEAFIYHGSSPYLSVDIDTSGCVVDRLYVYNSTTDSVIEISEQSVTAYTYTQTALYYVTEEQKIYKTDYSGTNHEYLYQSAQGDIDNLSSYFDALYFIEDRTSVRLLDVANKTAQEIWTYENLSWAIMLNDDQLIATTAEEDDYLYDIPTNTATLISDIEATSLITAAVIGTTSNNTRSTTPNFAAMVTQENNVSFPIEPYGATPDGTYSSVGGYYYGSPSSWFHTEPTQEGCYNAQGKKICERYSGSGECMGFAKYVHDVYAHMGEDTGYDSNGKKRSDETANELWEDRTCMTYHRPPAKAFEDGELPESVDPKLTERLFDGDVAKIKTFFNSLKTGAYVRYGKYHPSIQPNGDPTPENGRHSIVFIAKDDKGIWVYECNQTYDGNDNHGCGVFIQYYTFNQLTNYKFVLNYVNHNYSANWGYRDKDYHSKNCSGCAGHVKKEHTSVSKTYIDTNNHNATFNCCGDRVETVPHTNVSTKLKSRTQHQTTYNCCNHSLSAVAHTGSVEYYERSSVLHGVEYSCCSGYTTEPHILDTVNGQLQCTRCGYVSNSLLNTENEEIN